VHRQKESQFPQNLIKDIVEEWKENLQQFIANKYNFKEANYEIPKVAKRDIFYEVHEIWND